MQYYSQAVGLSSLAAQLTTGDRGLPLIVPVKLLNNLTNCHLSQADSNNHSIKAGLEGGREGRSRLRSWTEPWSVPLTRSQLLGSSGEWRCVYSCTVRPTGTRLVIGWHPGWLLPSDWECRLGEGAWRWRGGVGGRGGRWHGLVFNYSSRCQLLQVVVVALASTR